MKAPLSYRLWLIQQKRKARKIRHAEEESE
jgi:hypothetical protein